VESPASSEFVGEVDELDQTDNEKRFEPLGFTMSVNVDGPVQVHNLPSIAAGSRSYTAVPSTVGGAVKVCNLDPRRRVARIIAIEENIYYGTTQGVADSGTGVLWPKLVPLEITHGDEVWIRAAANTVTVSVIVENWAS
jgi:hypothetical protein